LTRNEEEERIIINRPDESTYPEEKSVSTSGATPAVSPADSGDHLKCAPYPQNRAVPDRRSQAGTAGHVRPESAVTIARKTHSVMDGGNFVNMLRQKYERVRLDLSENR